MNSGKQHACARFALSDPKAARQRRKTAMRRRRVDATVPGKSRSMPKSCRLATSIRHRRVREIAWIADRISTEYRLSTADKEPTP